uniref:TPR_REGION domain-containing protein n=1 Tax=Steinernema glaseri TaxID=37863 RepID=A0A1I8AKI7_9BILA
MSSTNEQRLSEARECIKRADNHHLKPYLIHLFSLKTSLIKLKFKPDYDSAAMEYERAAVCFKNEQEPLPLWKGEGGSSLNREGPWRHR